MESTLKFPDSSLDQLRLLYGFMAGREFVASRYELIDAGFSPSRIKNWVRSGRLITVARSVYSFGRDVQTREAVNRVALLLAGPGSALIGRTACEAHGIVRTWSAVPALVEVGSPVGQARSFDGLSPALRQTKFKVVSREFEQGDLGLRGGLSIAKAPLALVEFARDAPDRAVRFAFLDACRLELFNEPDLEYCYSRLFHRRGAARLRPCLELWVPELGRTKSVFEGWFLLVWRKRGYPIPLVNERVFGCEVDFFSPDHVFALELDGDAFHSDPAQKQIDFQKQRHLETNGVEVWRLTFREFNRDPIGEVDRIARHLGHCA